MTWGHAHPLNLQRNNSSDWARPSPIDKQRIDGNKKRHSHWQWLLLCPVAVNSALFCVWKQDWVIGHSCRMSVFLYIMYTTPFKNKVHATEDNVKRCSCTCSMYCMFLFLGSITWWQLSSVSRPLSCESTQAVISCCVYVGGLPEAVFSVFLDGLCL